MEDFPTVYFVHYHLSTEMEISMPWTCLQVLGKDEEGCEGSYNRIESRQAKLPMMPIAF